MGGLFGFERAQLANCLALDLAGLMCRFIEPEPATGFEALKETAGRRVNG